MAAKTPNRLINEKSPYLRQHADNPVQWFPWGNEAFDEAKRQNKPIFLSIGYSACHWCHVMEKESFRDEEVARVLNEFFVAVKVDREERPDIDSFYMDVCQVLSGTGGWPLTIIMTPDKKPIFAGTYFPKRSRAGLIGLEDLLSRLGNAWQESSSELLIAADRVRSTLETPESSFRADKISPNLLEKAYAQLAAQFDSENGGFGGAPKFPTPHHLTFLLRWAKRTGDRNALVMVERTLEAMRKGGLYDHLGFGFHRYSTDAQWRVPHFEKMIYDQALLAIAYTEAYEFTGREEYRKAVEETMAYVLRDMRSEQGGFFTAEDADSEGKEGKFYFWTEEEIKKTLTPAEAELAIRVFNIRPEGNFEEAGIGRTGKNILFLADQAIHIVARSSLSEENSKMQLVHIREKLFRARKIRPKPLRDTKILADWNGLMIAALAKASQAFERDDYAMAARKAADFVRAEMTSQEGLCHRYIEGEATIPAFLDDYAFLIWGLLELYEAAFDPASLGWALELADRALQKFWDEKEPGFFGTSLDVHDLPFRKKEIYDGAIPSGNSVMMANLLRLSRLTGNTELEEKAAKMAGAFSPRIAHAPMAYTQFLGALDFARGPSFEVVIVGRTGAKDTLMLLRSLHREFIPNKVVLFRPAEIRAPEILKLAPFLKPMRARGGKATAYVCSNFRCQLPVRDPAEMLALLKKP
jgi:uncharacterized protein YyaL (SSP411 family)